MRNTSRAFLQCIQWLQPEPRAMSLVRRTTISTRYCRSHVVESLENRLLLSVDGIPEGEISIDCQAMTPAPPTPAGAPWGWG